MPLAGLQLRAADVACKAFGLMLLATSSTVFANPCDALRRALSAEQQAKFGLAGQPCERLAPEDASALVDRPAAHVPASQMPLPHVDAAPSPMPRASQLAIYDAVRPAAIVTEPARKAVRLSPPSRPHDAGPRMQRIVARAAGGTSALRALSLSPDVDAAARRHDIDPLLLHAIAHVESRHNAVAVSPAGALGVMQVMPATARRFGVQAATQLHDAPTNLDVSASYLKTLQRRFGGDLQLILAAYNAGEGAVERHGRRIPPYAETRHYVRDVLERYGALSKVSRGLRGPSASADSSRPTL